MRQDAVTLQRFYASSLGTAVTRILSGKLTDLWGDARGLSLLGLGYALPVLDARDKALPDPRRPARVEVVRGVIPSVEVADDGDTARARRPNGEVDALDALVFEYVRAEVVVQIVVAPFVKEVGVLIAYQAWLTPDRAALERGALGFLLLLTHSQNH